jgi:hypothetical protein
MQKIDDLEGYETLLNNKNYMVNPTEGIVINEKRAKPIGKAINGYTRVRIAETTYQLHRLIWEHVNGEIPEGKVIDHIDFDRSNNKIENLQCITQKENVQRSVQNRSNKYFGHCQHFIKPVKIVFMGGEKDGVEEVKPSITQASKFSGVNPGQIKMICDGVNNCKTGTKNGQKYRFEYVHEKDKDINAHTDYLNLDKDAKTPRLGGRIRKFTDEERAQRKKEKSGEYMKRYLAKKKAEKVAED